MASWAEASVTLLCRSLQRINFSVILFWLGAVAVPVNFIMILGESWFSDIEIRLWSYSASQYGWMLMITVLNFIGFCAQTIAAQNERSGFVTLLGYIGLVYSFLGDLLIFNEMPIALEVVGVALIFVNNLIVVCQNWDS